MDIDRKIAELKGAKLPFCTATVVKAEGSAPRGVGAKMIVTADETFGTVGGGALEAKAIADAREILRLRGNGTKRYELDEESGQVCGGAVEIYFETWAPKSPAVVFGAGHIAESLVPMLLGLGYDTTVIDERPERISLPAFAEAKRICAHPMDAIGEIEFGDDLHIICMTHAHAHDEEIVGHCLGRPFRYLGLISSRRKWALFRERYLARGIPEKELSRVSAPIGLDIGAETPLEIAIAIAAELIQLKARPEDYAKGVCHFR